MTVGWLLSPSGWPVHADTADEYTELSARGYDPIVEADVAPAVAAFQAAEASPPSTQLPGWALAADVATALALKANASTVAGKLSISDIADPGTTGGAALRAAFVASDDARMEALDDATTFALGSTLVKRSAQGNAEYQNVTLHSSPTDPKHATPKSYVDAAIVAHALPASSGGDDTAAVQAALDAFAAAGGGVAYAHSASTYRFDSGLTWDMALVGVDGQGSTFDFSGMTTGVAITMSNSTTDVYRTIIPGGLRNVEIGGAGEASATSGIFLGTDASSTAVPFGTFDNVAVHDFGIGLNFGPHSWSQKFYNCTVYECGTCIDNSAGTVEAGECIAFFGCTFFNSGKCVNKAAGGGYEFFGCSFDYCTDVMINVAFGHVGLYGCHVEYAASAVVPFVVSGDGTFNMTAGEIYQAGAAASEYVINSLGRARFTTVVFNNVSTTSGLIAALWDEQTVCRDCTLPAGLAAPTDHIIRKNGATVTGAPGWAIGTGAPDVDVTGCTDTRGIIKFGTGTTPAAGTMVDITYATPYNTPPVVVVSSSNNLTEARHPCVVTTNGAGFGLGFQVAPVASQPAGTYWVAYHVIG